jgi:hypothetical protein
MIHSRPHPSAYPKPKPERLPRRKTVTIAAGLKCLDGIVICADSEETISESAKRQVIKLELRPATFPDQDDPVAIFTGAGDSVFIDEVINEMWSAAVKTSEKELDKVVQAMQTANRLYHRKIWKIYPPLYSTSDLPDADLLFAVWAKDGYGLYEARSVKFRPVKDFATIGCGESLAHYICDPAHKSIARTVKAVTLAIYMLAKVKDHVPGCGGDSRIAILTHTGGTNMLDTFKTDKIAQHLSLAEGLVNNILLTSADLNVKDEGFKAAVDYYENELITLRKNLREEIEKFETIWDHIMEEMRKRKREAFIGSKSKESP